MAKQLFHGSDLVHVPRVAQAYARHGQKLLNRLLTPQEQAYCLAAKDHAAQTKRIAARMAAKEAMAKALGVGLNGLGWGQGIGWHSIEIISQDKAAPTVHLHGRGKALSDQAGVRQWQLSLSHDGDYAMATVVGLAEA